MSFKKVLLLAGIIGLVGCSKAPQEYVDAAERYAEDTCEGIVVDKAFDREYLASSREVVMQKLFYYTCITEKGSERLNFPYKAIPIKYFKKENN